MQVQKKIAGTWHPMGILVASKRHMASKWCSGAETTYCHSRQFCTLCSMMSAGQQSRTGCHTAKHVGVGALLIAIPGNAVRIHLQCWQLPAPVAIHSIDSTVSTSRGGMYLGWL